jgi:hypothetical protein
MTEVWLFFAQVGTDADKKPSSVHKIWSNMSRPSCRGTVEFARRDVMARRGLDVEVWVRVQGDKGHYLTRAGLHLPAEMGGVTTVARHRDAGTDGQQLAPQQLPAAGSAATHRAVMDHSAAELRGDGLSTHGGAA